MTFVIKEQYTPAQLEMDIQMTSSLARMSNIIKTCSLCVSDGEMTKAEALCIDRCIKKFIKVAEIVENKSKERIEAQQQMLQ